MADTEEVVAPPPGGNKKLLIVVLVFNVLIAGGLGYLVMFGQKTHAAEKPVAEGEGEGHGPLKFGPLVDVGSMVVNLSGPEPGHYMKVSVHVEAKDEESKKLVEAALVPIRSEVLLYLNGIAVKDVVGPDKMRSMADELKTRVAKMIGTENVKHVYFSEFVIQ